MSDVAFCAQINMEEDDHEIETTGVSVLLKTQATANMPTGIQYFPSQMDPLAGTSTRALRESPLWLMIRDAGVLFKMIRYMPNIILPIKASSNDDELYMSLAGTLELLFQGFLIVFETILLIAAPFALLILPGFICILALSLICLSIYLLCLPLQGPNICFSTIDDATSTLANNKDDERWLFVNGCATNHAGLQKNIDRLSKTFGRRVTGIHNKSFGLVGDILECLIQRCFAYKTNDVRVAYNYLKPLLSDPSAKKIVLLGHSQGGLIISLVLDQLFAEMPPENMSKLEIYTFGSAASHFSNPAISLCPTTKPPSLNPKVHFDGPYSPAERQHVIEHIEHYANEYDVIPRWGVLHSVCDIQNNRYAGSVFVRMCSSGHLLNQHYLDAMFPLPQPDIQPSLTSFLDRTVSVDLRLVWNRAVSPAAKATGILRSPNNGLEFGTGDVMLPNDQKTANGSGPEGTAVAASPKTGNPVLIFSRTTSGIVVGEETNGKTVRELSRLWKYLGGNSPGD